MGAEDGDRRRAEQAEAAQPRRRAGAGPLGGVIDVQDKVEAKEKIKRETE